MVGLAKTKGSAEAATSPSHGSNNPEQENAVNRQQPNTARAKSASAPFDYRAAYYELEDQVAHAVGMARVLAALAEFVAEWRIGSGIVSVPAKQLDNFLFMARRVEQSVENLEGVWSETWPAECAAMDAQAEALQNEGRDLRERIEAHTAAHRALCDSMVLDDENRIGGGIEQSDRTRECEKLEEEAFDTLLSVHLSTNAAQAERLRYLLSNPHSPWRDNPPIERTMNLLLASMVDR